MSRSTLPLFPTDDGWPYPDGDQPAAPAPTRNTAPEARYPADGVVLAHRAAEPSCDDEPDLDALELRADPHVFDSLSETERRALFARFGLRGENPCSMKELSALLGCSHADTREVLGAAIDKMRLRLAAS